MGNNKQAVKILDCTLRDGGYLNNWCFGTENIPRIIKLLHKTRIDYIECGFYRPVVEYEKDRTVFKNLNELIDLTNGMDKSFLTLMLNFEDAEDAKFNNLENFILRLAFKKHHIDEIKPLCEKLKDKAARIFLNPMHASTYNERELEKLLEVVDFVSPECLTIVDTMGIMNEHDTEKLFLYLDKFLTSNISLGFHSHNNLNLSFKNALKVIGLGLNREIIIDSCVSGLGRCAGIIPTEAITQYFNDKFNKKYKMKYLNDITDNYLYSLRTKFANDDKYPYYLSAVNKCHPYYAKYLKEKMNLSYIEMNKILSEIPEENKAVYDEKVFQDFKNI